MITVMSPIKYNYTKLAVNTKKNIVIHETNNEDEGANALAHYRYWGSYIPDPAKRASAHFVCDDHSTLQLAPAWYKCWHVGDNKGHSNIYNGNSIGNEICVNKGGDYMKARRRAIMLTGWQMNEYNIPLERIFRHQDASGKPCPKTMIKNPSLWYDFKTRAYMASMADKMRRKKYLSNVELWYSILMGEAKASSNNILALFVNITKKSNISEMLDYLVKKKIIGDKDYWTGVLKGTTTLNPIFLKLIFERL